MWEWAWKSRWGVAFCQNPKIQGGSLRRAMGRASGRRVCTSQGPKARGAWCVNGSQFSLLKIYVVSGTSSPPKTACESSSSPVYWSHFCLKVVAFSYNPPPFLLFPRFFTLCLQIRFFICKIFSFWLFSAPDLFLLFASQLSGKARL